MSGLTVYGLVLFVIMGLKCSSNLNNTTHDDMSLQRSRDQISWRKVIITYTNDNFSNLENTRHRNTDNNDEDGPKAQISVSFRREERNGRKPKNYKTYKSLIYLLKKKLGKERQKESGVSLPLSQTHVHALMHSRTQTHAHTHTHTLTSPPLAPVLTVHWCKSVCVFLLNTSPQHVCVCVYVYIPTGGHLLNLRNCLL